MLLVVPEHLHTLVADARLAVVMLTAGPDFLPCGSGKSLSPSLQSYTQCNTKCYTQNLV